VERARDGDASAFGALYRTHLAGVEAVVRAHVHNGPVVADIVQETFMRALASIDRLIDPDHFRPWLLSIARHVAIDHQRRQQKTVGVEPEVADAVPDSSLGPEVVAELSELAQLVRGCVIGLSRRDALAIDLVTYFGFSPGDVAATLGLTAGAAKVMIHRARRRLRDALVLELMVRRRGSGCAELAALLDRGDPVAAARHVRTCELCQQIASDEVRPYDSSPVTRTPVLLNASERASGSDDGRHGSSVKAETSSSE
jgi:RNA polymerase sigma factor (sigma-70 family)